MGTTFSTGVNVNTTDAKTGATALLLPAQNTHTLHAPYMTPYETRSMRARRARAGGALAALRMVWASAAWMAEEM